MYATSSFRFYECLCSILGRSGLISTRLDQKTKEPFPLESLQSSIMSRSLFVSLCNIPKLPCGLKHISIKEYFHSQTIICYQVLLLFYKLNQ